MEKIVKRDDVQYYISTSTCATTCICVLSSSTASNCHNQISELHHTPVTPPSDADIICDAAVAHHQRFLHGKNSLTHNNPPTINNALTRQNNLALMPNRSFLCMDSQPNCEIQNEKESTKDCKMAKMAKIKNRRVGDDAFTASLSALYAKVIVILGCALPVTEVLTSRIPTKFYEGFYVYLYLGSIAFVIFVYATHMKSRAAYALIKNNRQKNNVYQVRKKASHFGSIYLRIGAITFGIGSMVYSGLEIGKYFELSSDPECKNFTMLLTPICRMAITIFQMQFIFLNTVEFDLGRHKVIARFGLMHMVATNLCEWLYILVEETKHEIYHLTHAHSMEKVSERTTDAITLESNVTHPLTSSADHLICQRTNIMGNLIQNASPFLFPCTIEWSLICAVILFEMWKQVRSLPEIEKTRRNCAKPPHPSQIKSAHHFSVDCSRAHRGMFAGILVIVLTIISLIMYFVLHKEPEYKMFAMQEVTICEITLYTITSAAVIAAMLQMRDMKYQRKSNVSDHHADSVALDCTLLILAQTGGYIYGMFSLIGCFFGMKDGTEGADEGFFAEIMSLVQTSLQTLFILNVSWRRCRGQQQIRSKPGREIVTFLLVANMALWFINTLVKGHAGFRPTHIDFYGMWAWTVITHISMPLAIFYRFHSTICLFEIWKSAYKVKADH